MRKKLYKILSLFIAILLIIGIISACDNTYEKDESGNNFRADIVVSPDSTTQISDDLFGIFLEDINFAVDAGLYAELVKNRSFEYGSLASDNAKHGWTVTSSSGFSFEISKESGLNENNPTYAVLTNTTDTPQGIYNKGYLDGLAVKAGESYTVSVYFRGSAEVYLSLEDKNGKVYAEDHYIADVAQWNKHTSTLTPTETVNKDLYFVLRIGRGSVDADMISLMPDDTYKGLPVRKDIGEALEALEPSFLRFPGGCVIEGKTEETTYNWKDSIGNGLEFYINGVRTVGDVAARPQTTDLWVGNGAHPYYCTYGLGFYEYFLLCEALDCFAVPIVNAGMTCPIQSSNYMVHDVNSEEFKQYVQDALDLAEFCKGGADTYWGSVRIAMGHEEPFELKYIGIGNEQWQSEYHSHYSRFVEAFEEAARENPEVFGGIELIVANGPSSGSTEGWTYLRKNPDDITTLVDEHYYEQPSWFLANTERYDSYSRNTQAKVFIGEYASKSNTMNSALAEAVYMTGIERNGDIIELACYAPLFGNSTLNQWTPDMIFFSKDSLCLTPNYYVQQLFACNAGTEYLDTAVDITGAPEGSGFSGKVGLGSWMTSVSYDNLKVVSNDSGKVLYSSDFENYSDFRSDFDYHEGDWNVENGALVQKNIYDPADTTTGDTVYVGDVSWGNYTMTVDAKILDGAEGFLIPICVQNDDNNIFWNVGGWGNTVSCLQIVSGGSKSDQVSGTVKNIRLNRNQVYKLKVEVNDNSIKCYIDDVLYINYTNDISASVFASSVRDKNGDIIVKIVNVSGDECPADITIDGIGSSKAEVAVLSAEHGAQVNDFDSENNIVPVRMTIDVSGNFAYTAPAYSLSVIRIKAE